MKKLLCILATLSLFILAIGCSSSNSDNKSKNTSSSSNKSVSSTNPSSTDISPTTSSNKTIVDKNNNKPTAASMEFKSEKLGFSFVIPESWKDKYRVEETDKSVSVYFKPNTKSETDGQGLFFTIIKKTDVLHEDQLDTVGETRYFQTKGITYVIGGPTDVNFSEHNSEFSTFLKMGKDVPGILKTLKSNENKKDINWKQNSQSKTTGKTIAQSSYKTYINNRFGFRIDYPSIFETKLLSDNNDGVILSNPDDGAELTVSGINNVSGYTATSACNDLLKNHNNPTYKKQEGNWFVVSWIEGDKIVYEKSVVGNGSINTFVIKYPSNKKEIYDPIICHLNSTFKTPLTNSYH